MEYQAIKYVLYEHSKEVLDRRKGQLALHGRLSELDKSALGNGHDSL